MDNKILKRFFVACLLMLLACVVTYPAFVGHRLFFTWDGSIFLGRIEQIYHSLINFKLPTPVNYMWLDHNLGVMNAMYPWLTSLIFVIPKFFISNKMLALVIGFVILNYLTALNFYLLSKKMTRLTLLQWLGTTLYLFNGYHLEDMYVRNAMGESLAYAFLPLVVLGCLMIWDRQQSKLGIVALSLGIVGVLNSHILSFVLVIGCLLITELVRCFLLKLDRNEIIAFLYSALWSIVGSLYCLVQLLSISLSNKHLYTPDPHLNYVVPSVAFNEMINNHMRVLYSTWHIGLVTFGLLIFLLIMSLNSRMLFSWTWLTWLAFFGLLFSFGFIPCPNFIEQHFISKFQFTGRAYVLVVLFVSIAIVLYFRDQQTNKYIISALVLVTIALGWSSVMNYKNKPTILDHAETMWTLDNVDYHKFLNVSKTCRDYTIDIQQKGKKPSHVDWVSSTYDSASYDVKVPKQGWYTLPISRFNKQKYSLYVNGKRAPYKAIPGRFGVYFVRKQNTVKISSTTPFSYYVLFAISIVTISGLICYWGRQCL